MAKEDVTQTTYTINQEGKERQVRLCSSRR